MTDLSTSLVSLKQSFDTGATLQTAFVSSKMLKHIENLGSYLMKARFYIAGR
jgi:hypothetical protein